MHDSSVWYAQFLQRQTTCLKLGTPFLKGQANYNGMLKWNLHQAELTDSHPCLLLMQHSVGLTLIFGQKQVLEDIALKPFSQPQVSILKAILQSSWHRNKDSGKFIQNQYFLLLLGKSSVLYLRLEPLLVMEECRQEVPAAMHGLGREWNLHLILLYCHWRSDLALPLDPYFHKMNKTRSDFSCSCVGLWSWALIKSGSIKFLHTLVVFQPHHPTFAVSLGLENSVSCHITHCTPINPPCENLKIFV